MIPFSTRWVEAISKCSCPVCTTVMKFFTRYWVDDEPLGCFDTLIPKMHNPVPFKKDEVYCHCALLQTSNKKQVHSQQIEIWEDHLDHLMIIWTRCSLHPWSSKI
jgi:hypothetical protein